MTTKNIVYALDHIYPEWKSDSPLSPDVLVLCISYLADEKTEYNNKERIHSTCFFIDGNRYGESTFYWDRSGSMEIPIPIILSQGMYINNSKHGEHNSYHRNGTLSQRSFFNKGYLHGENQTYWYNGRPHIFSNYVNGKLDGKYMYWWENGVLMFDGQHIDNQRVGRWKEYHPSGALTFDGMYVNGDKVIP